MGTFLLSRRSWSVHLVRGWPGGCFHEWFGGQPTDSSTWRSMAWCAGVLSGILATCPKMALRPLVIQSDTGARPVRKETSEIGIKSCHLIPRILRWHFMWKDSMAFMSLASKVHVSNVKQDWQNQCLINTNCRLNRKMFSIPDVIEWRHCRGRETNSTCDVWPVVSVRRLDTAKVSEILHKVYGVAINHDV